MLSVNGSMQSLGILIKYLSVSRYDTVHIGLDIIKPFHNSHLFVYLHTTLSVNISCREVSTLDVGATDQGQQILQLCELKDDYILRIYVSV